MNVYIFIGAILWGIPILIVVLHHLIIAPSVPEPGFKNLDRLHRPDPNFRVPDPINIKRLPRGDEKK